MNGAQLTVNLLKEHGIKSVFGYPGGAIMPIYDALYDGGIEHILCRHEQGAAMAAIGYARSTSGIGVCLATSGPGATNLITGLADAMMDSIPIVAITGQVASPLIGTDAFQEMDVLGLSLSCTKHSFLVTDPAKLSSTIAKAFAIAKEGRPGPVLIDIAKDVQIANIDLVSAFTPLDNDVISPCEASIQKANELIKNSKKPVVYVGGGVQLGNAIESLRDFLTRTHMPVTSTLKGLGCITHDNAYYLGMLGMHGTKAANLAVQEADLLIAVGARFDDRVTGKLDTFAPNAAIIHLDIDAAEFDKLRRANVSLQGELNTALNTLTAPDNIDAWQTKITSLKNAHAWRYDHPGDHVFAPLLLKQLSDLMPASTVYATDVGQHQMWAAQHINPSQPENFLTSAGLGTMGFGLPAAIGAKVARPHDEVGLISGDGSFMMNIQELGTLKRRNIPVKMVLIDNQRLGMVRQWQALFFDGRFSETDLSDNPDFITLASAFNIPGQTITKKSEVLPALQTLLASETAYLLHVVISEEENVWPLVPPGAANQNMMEGKQ